MVVAPKGQHLVFGNTYFIRTFEGHCSVNQDISIYLRRRFKIVVSMKIIVSIMKDSYFIFCEYVCEETHYNRVGG